MIELTREEQSMLNGEQGRLKQVAMENVVKYAEVLGAERLCKVTKATIFCGAHNYLKVCDSPDFHEVFTRLNLARDERIVFDSIDPDCYAQTCVAPCDQFEYEPLHQPKELFAKTMVASLGVKIKESKIIEDISDGKTLAEIAGFKSCTET